MVLKPMYMQIVNTLKSNYGNKKIGALNILKILPLFLLGSLINENDPIISIISQKYERYEC